MRPECEDVVCSPCAFWNKAVCESGKCKGIYEEVTGESCVKTEAGEEMSFSEAQEIALESECIEEGSY